MSRILRILVILSVLAASVSAFGCRSKRVILTRGAVTLGNTDANAKEIWIYIQTADPRVDGVYRCKDESSGVTCTKAEVIHTP